MKRKIGATLDRWFTPNFSSQSPLCMRWISRLISKTFTEGYTDAIRTIKMLDHRQSLESLETSVLAVTGLHDHAIPLSVVKAMVEGLLRGRLLTLDDSAHLSCVETPVSSLKKSLSFYSTD